MILLKNESISLLFPQTFHCSLLATLLILHHSSLHCRETYHYEPSSIHQERIHNKMSAATLEDRVVALERVHYKCPKEIAAVDESMRRARTEVEALGLYSSRWVWVPEPYYTWPLEQRAKKLKAPSTAHLCKSLLLENKKVTNETHDFWLHPRFVMVVLQYDAELSTDLLTKSIRKQRSVTERLDPTHFDWRVADPEDNDRITGYQFNSVTPLVSTVVRVAPVSKLDHIPLGSKGILSSLSNKKKKHHRHFKNDI